jgi:hypothetical protein
MNPAEFEDQMYRFPGRQLGWRVSQCRAQGYPCEVEKLGDGNYIVIVRVPVGAPNPFAYTPRRRSAGWGAPAQVRVAGVVIVLALVGYLVWSFFGGAASMPSSAGAETRAAFSLGMDAIGLALVLGLGLLCVWMLRPLLGGLVGLARSAAGVVGRMRR